MIRGVDTPGAYTAHMATASPRRLRFAVRYHRVVRVLVRSIYVVVAGAWVVAMWSAWPGPVPIHAADGSTGSVGWWPLALGIGAFLAVLIGFIELVSRMAWRELARVQARVEAAQAPSPAMPVASARPAVKEPQP
jgi:hypothetical protein